MDTLAYVLLQANVYYIYFPTSMIWSYMESVLLTPQEFTVWFPPENQT